jgi:hypothetical protein
LKEIENAWKHDMQKDDLKDAQKLNWDVIVGFGGRNKIMKIKCIGLVGKHLQNRRRRVDWVSKICMDSI